jgi:hypothetical protein
MSDLCWQYFGGQKDHGNVRNQRTGAHGIVVSAAFSGADLLHVNRCSTVSLAGGPPV